MLGTGVVDTLIQMRVRVSYERNFRERIDVQQPPTVGRICSRRSCGLDLIYRLGNPFSRSHVAVSRSHTLTGIYFYDCERDRVASDAALCCLCVYGRGVGRCCECARLFVT